MTTNPTSLRNRALGVVTGFTAAAAFVGAGILSSVGTAKSDLAERYGPKAADAVATNAQAVCDGKVPGASKAEGCIVAAAAAVSSEPAGKRRDSGVVTTKAAP